jgi:multidrug efflux pump subunit AcrB
MVGFLIKRPIAVLMTFLGLLALGLVAGRLLPVSLVPDIDIPRISVRVEAPAYSARELESAVMDRLRMHLMQVNKLVELKSEARDGSGLISLEFDYGTNVDLAYIEVNEQVDKAVASLPRDLSRPAVIKASASDIPVFYLDVSLRPGGKPPAAGRHGEQAFLELSNFVDEIIRRRLEQIPQVAMADMSGRSFAEIVVTPRTELLQSIGLLPEAIENTIRAANLSLGNIILRDKQFQYHVRAGGQLVNAGDIAGLFLNHRGRVWQLGELCHIETRVRETEGLVLSQNQRAISLAIIKQGDARMQDLKTELHQMVSLFENDYPHLQFSITRDQTQLLDLTLANLGQTLVVGAFLAFLVMFLFLRDPRAPWIIMVAVPAALIISLLFFFMAGMSVNIISISGLILCIGMMIDNSIIVIDNITRYRKQGKPLYEACVTGTNEVFTPLLSSVLTTCSVFIPLVFLSGLAGALFFDQAMAVSIGLLVSLAIAITLIPTLYYAIYRKKPVSARGLLARLNPIDYERLYTRGFHFVMRRQWVVWGVFLLLAALLPLMLAVMEKERMPQMQRQATQVWIDWNENIHLEENLKRIDELLLQIGDLVEQSAVQAGRQQFLLESLHNNSRQQCLVYLLAASEKDLEAIEDLTRAFMSRRYPRAILQFREEGNLFDQVFGDRQAPLELRLKPLQNFGSQLALRLQQTIDTLQQALPHLHFDPVPLQQNLLLEADLQLMALHQVDMGSLQRSLSRIFNENQVITLMDSRAFVPVKVGSRQGDLHQMLQTTTVTNRQGVEVPLQLLVSRSRGADLPVITAGLEGEYFPLALEVEESQLNQTTQTIQQQMQQLRWFEAGFSGSLFARQVLVKELLVIAIVALLLLFFILAAQFESLTLPFIVLLEVPLAMAGALAMLMLFGASLNIMSMIGLVVMAGIIINDSILKIDTINRLRAGGMSLLRALYTAGHYRLKPILMTSITTIFALLPILFISGLGGDLQKPLALVVIGGLGLGTFVSLYFIPVFYYYLYRTTKKRR